MQQGQGQGQRQVLWPKKVQQGQRQRQVLWPKTKGPSQPLPCFCFQPETSLAELLKIRTKNINHQEEELG